MIIRKRKQLIQLDIIKGGQGQNLQKRVERKLHGQILIDDRNERLNRDRHPYLFPLHVIRRPVKRLDPEILFDPAEEQFDFPTKVTELGDRLGGQKKVVRQKNQMTVVLAIEKNGPDEEARENIVFGFGAGQAEGLVRSQVQGFIDGSRRESSRLKNRLGSDD